MIINFEASMPPFFKFFPKWQQVSYLGEPAAGVRQYSVSGAENSKECLLMSELIFGEDKPLWESWKELYTFAVKTAEAQITGTYDLDLLCLGPEAALRSFQPQNLAGLIVNQARKLSPGERVFFSYASGWLSFKKLLPGDWGKIRFGHNVTVFNKERSQLGIFIKKILEFTSALEEPVWIGIRDLSRIPLWRFGEEPQTERLEKHLRKHEETIQKKVKALYILHNDEVSDVAGQFGITAGDTAG